MCCKVGVYILHDVCHRAGFLQRSFSTRLKLTPSFVLNSFVYDYFKDKGAGYQTLQCCIVYYNNCALHHCIRMYVQL